MRGAFEGEEGEAAAEDVELEEVEFFEGEVAAGAFHGFRGGREVEIAEGGEAGEPGEVGVGGGRREDVGPCVRVGCGEDEEGGAAEGFLGDAVRGAVDGGDAVDVDGGVVGVSGEDFVFRVIDDETAVGGGFDFAEGDDFHVCGEGFVEPWEIEPAEDDWREEVLAFEGLEGDFDEGFAEA